MEGWQFCLGGTLLVALLGGFLLWRIMTWPSEIPYEQLIPIAKVAQREGATHFQWWDRHWEVAFYRARDGQIECWDEEEALSSITKQREFKPTWAKCYYNNEIPKEAEPIAKILNFRR